MTLYEIIIPAVALGNMLLSVGTLLAARSKAATTRLEELESSLRGQLQEHEVNLARLLANSENCVTHEHLADVYSDIKGIAAQLNVLVGQQMQMNENMRLLLQRVVHHP